MVSIDVTFAVIAIVTIRLISKKPSLLYVNGASYSDLSEAISCCAFDNMIC